MTDIMLRVLLVFAQTLFHFQDLHIGREGQGQAMKGKRTELVMKQEAGRRENLDLF